MPTFHTYSEYEQWLDSGGNSRTPVKLVGVDPDTWAKRYQDRNEIARLTAALEAAEHTAKGNRLAAEAEAALRAAAEAERDTALAMVATAYVDASDVALGSGFNGFHDPIRKKIATAILARIKPDATAALDRLIADKVAEAVEVNKDSQSDQKAVE